MCRNIKTLFNFEPPVTEEAIRMAAFQFVRKVSGFNKPSKANEAAFLTHPYEEVFIVQEGEVTDPRRDEQPRESRSNFQARSAPVLRRD